MKINQKNTGLEQNQKRESQDKKEEDDITQEINDKSKNFEQTAFFDRLVLRLEAKREKENWEQTTTVQKEMTSRKDVPASLPIPTFIKKNDKTKSISFWDKEDEVKENKNINENNEKDKMEETDIKQDSSKAKFLEERNPIEIYSVQYTPIQNLEKFLDSMGVIVLMIFVTIFVLVGDDTKTLSLTYIADQAFDYAKTACFSLFLLEIILTCIAKKGYLFSFFFYLDIVSTLSLIQDIDFMINPLIGLSDS